MSPTITKSLDMTAIANAIKSRTNLRIADSSNIELWTWSVKRIGADRGNVANLLRLSLEWRPKEVLPATVVLKLRNHDANNPKREDFFGWTHKSECAFYNFVSDQQWNLPLPKCYLASLENPGMIILEDLSDGTLVDLFDGISFERCLKVAENIASFHACCLRNSDWKSVPDLNDPARNMLASATEMLMTYGKPVAIDVMNEWSGEFGSLIERFKEICITTQREGLIDQVNVDFGLPKVLVHGDLHVHNMIFNCKDGTSVLALIDWQAVHFGSVVEDFAKLLYLSAEPDMRRQHKAAIFSHYYQCLQGSLKPLELPFSLETFDKAFDKEMRNTTVLTVIGLLSYSRADAKLGEDREKKKRILINRAKCMLEDCLDSLDSAIE